MRRGLSGAGKAPDLHVCTSQACPPRGGLAGQERAQTLCYEPSMPASRGPGGPGKGPDMNTRSHARRMQGATAPGKGARPMYATRDHARTQSGGPPPQERGQTYQQCVHRCHARTHSGGTPPQTRGQDLHVTGCPCPHAERGDPAPGKGARRICIRRHGRETAAASGARQVRRLHVCMYVCMNALKPTH